MIKQLATLLIAVALLNLTGFGQVGPDRSETARGVVSELGTGPKAKVEIKLVDSTKLKGHVTDSGKDSFTVVEEKTGTQRVILFTNVAQIKKRHLGFGTGAWIAIAATAAAAAVLIGFISARCRNEPGSC